MKEGYRHTKPAEIEAASMEIIEREMAERGIECPADRLAVVKRVIHTTADFDYGENLAFTEDAVKRSIENIRKGNPTFITDTNMALSGISKPALEKLSSGALCYMARPDIMEEAKKAGTTRAYASMKRAAEEFPEGIFVSGNAPTALMALSESIREGLRPTLVIGVPVGFVNVVESKKEIFDICSESGVPAIVAFGRKGGSNVAAAICNALLYSALDRVDPAKRTW